jgi:heme/copper-type cytochrome/quinol oxidase subunit 2
MENITNVISSSFSNLNNSKFFAGIMMLVVNIGSRYVTFKFSKSQEEYIKNKIAREFLIFAIVWMATRDLIISVIMTASFIILADYLFNENSKFCIMPEKFKNIQYLIDTNNDGIITDEEIKNAEETLRKAKLQKNKMNQLEMLSYLSTNQPVDNVYVL